MRRLMTIVSGTAIAFLLAVSMPPAAEAAPQPLPREWWFAAWAVATKIWPVTQGEGVTVAVLDTGVQADLPDFAGAVLPGTDATGGGGDGRVDTDNAPVLSKTGGSVRPTAERAGRRRSPRAGSRCCGRSSRTNLVRTSSSVSSRPCVTSAHPARTTRPATARSGPPVCWAPRCRTAPPTMLGHAQAR
jgi:hypothetical protein